MSHTLISPAELKEHYNLNVSRLARWMGVDQSMISHVLHGRKKTHYIRRAIAARCGLRPEQIWPEEKAS